MPSLGLAVPGTDLLVDAERYLVDVNTMLSLARSGDSPESAAVMDLVRNLRPDILQLARRFGSSNRVRENG